MNLLEENEVLLRHWQEAINAELHARNERDLHSQSVSVADLRDDYGRITGREEAMKLIYPDDYDLDELESAVARKLSLRLFLPLDRMIDGETLVRQLESERDYDLESRDDFSTHDASWIYHDARAEAFQVVVSMVKEMMGLAS